MSVGRRDFLEGLVVLGATGAASRALAGEAAPAAAPPAAVAAPAAAPRGRSTEDLYRAEFAQGYGDGEKHGYAYHCVNCQGNCAWDVWVDQGGRITRENQ